MIHRADYHGVLLKEAVRLGGKLRTNAEVVDINFAGDRPAVVLHTGETITADVVVGADGSVICRPSPGSSILILNLFRPLVGR